MDWTISILNEWIGPVLGVTCESPSDSYCPGKPGNLHSEREKWENGKIYYSVKCAKDAFFVGYQSDKKMRYQSQFNVWRVFWILKEAICRFLLPLCLAMHILQMKRKEYLLQKKRKPIMILGQLAN